MALLRRLTDGQKRDVGHWAMEFVVVVAGVLVALWLQEWVERRGELAAMRAAEQAIQDEVNETLLSLMWREAISQCHRDRAELLQSRLLSSGTHWEGLKENTLTSALGTLPGSVSPSVYQRPVDTFTNSAWTSALATGALGPMDRKRFGNLVALYDQIDLKTIEVDPFAELPQAYLTLHPFGRVPALTHGAFELSKRAQSRVMSIGHSMVPHCSRSAPPPLPGWTRSSPFLMPTPIGRW